MSDTFLHKQTLVLNADFRPLSFNPLSVWPWEDAVSAIYKDKAVVVESYNIPIHSPTVVMKIPSVIALKEYVYANQEVRFTRYNVYLRDNFTCLYCGAKPPVSELTFDHVHPRCRGGATTWLNIATSCIECNQIKNDKPVYDAYFPKFHHGSTELHPLSGQKMKLRYTPYAPTAEQFRRPGRIKHENLHQHWVDYLYWSSELSESEK